MKKRIIVFLLSLFFLLAIAVSASAAETEGYFVLTVCTANNVIVSPERVYYSEGQTVKEALLASGHTFEGLAERNFIDSIDGEIANYTFFYDGGGYNMEVPASEITAMRFGVTTVPSANQEAVLSMIKTMAGYSAMENHVQNYPDAEKAYKQCLNAIRGDGSNTVTAESSLNSAIAAYEAILNGPKYRVSFEAYKGDEIVSGLQLIMTDAYKNVTTAQGSTIDVIAGDYTFCVSDGSYNRTEGTTIVKNNTNISINLPTGEWYGDIYMREYNWTTGYREPYRSEQDQTNHKLTVWMDDSSEGYYAANMVVFIGDVPDEQTTLLKTCYIGNDEEAFDYTYYYTPRSWSNSANSYGNYLPSLVSAGMEGRTFSLEAWYTGADGYKQIQSYEVEIIRVPTFASVTAIADGTRLSVGDEVYSSDGVLLPNRKLETWEYFITTISDVLDITAIPFDSNYTVSGDGRIEVPEGDSVHYITVTAANGSTSTYTFNISKVSSVPVFLDVPDGVNVEVSNDIGVIIKPVEGVYHLIPGEKYTYTATKDTYYHTQASFIAEQELIVTVTEPVEEDWLTALGIYPRKFALESELIYPNTQFSSDNHEYAVYYSDCSSNMYLEATTAVGKAYMTFFGQTDIRPGVLKKVEIERSVGSHIGTATANFLIPGGYGEHMSVIVEYEEDGVVFYQDYHITVERILHLYDLSVTSGAEAITLQDQEKNAVEFDRDIHEYNVEVNRDADSIELSGSYPVGSTTAQTQYIGGYYAVINGMRYDCNLIIDGSKKVLLDTVTIPLDTEIERETITIQVFHEDTDALSATYTINVIKTVPVEITVQAEPEDLTFVVINNTSGKRIYDEEGVYLLTPGSRYTYTATRAGYIGIKEETYIAPENDTEISVSLQRAPESETLVNYTAEWPHLRQDNNNNGVIDYPTPTEAGKTVLYWAKAFGSDYSDGAVSQPIMVNGFLYAYSGTSLYKIDPNTGSTLASGAMSGKSSFAINPPTYAEGMIFVGLANGTIQAFNASTLESLWVYHDSLGGQPNCPIVYENGYVYTGFWLTEGAEANYVCLSATDEDPNTATEEKLATWTYTSKGGFYWAGAYTNGSFVLVGTDDGATSYVYGYPRLLSLDAKTGKTISEITLPVKGDIRSSITAYNGKYYFTNKGGYFFEASVSEDGVIQNLRSLNLGGMSTSTPAIYNGRAYVGVCGSGQFNGYSGHAIAVIDILNWEIAYKASTQGYPQGSGVITTAYENETGKVYAYFFDNYTPGKLRVLEDMPGQVEPSLTTVEGPYSTALNLFEPVGEHAQFALVSPIVDANGTMYFKNDSGYLMAVGSTVDHLEVVQNPDKMTYQAGEMFDGTGLAVTAHFTNGTNRDVTKHMTWSEEPLTADDTDFQMEYPLVMYQNTQQEDGSMLAGVEITPPIATLTLTIESDTEVLYGDVNEDGIVNLKDVNMLFRFISGSEPATDSQKITGNVDGIGAVDLRDLNILFKKVSGQISSFPVEQIVSP